MQPSEPTSPRKRFNHKTISNQAINNAPGWCGRGDVPTLKVSHCAGISSTFIVLEREGDREQDWVPSIRERVTGSRIECPASEKGCQVVGLGAQHQ